MAPIHIVLPTPAMGGAEKRFLGLFLGLLGDLPELRLVADGRLLQAARRSDELAGLRQDLGPRVSTFGPERFSLQRALARAFAASPRSVFHYVLVPPPLAQWFPSRRTVFTIPLSGLNLYGSVGRASLYAGALVAARTDFLDQGVHDAVATKLPWLRRRFSVTPGSFVDTGFYEPLPAADKKPIVTFVGLFSHEKQAFRLVDALPRTAELLRESGHSSVAFRLFGRDSGEESLSERVAAISRTVDVQASFEPDPRKPLARAKVFLSLQRNTNYPSKSLLEALACGALPVVTRVGDSHRMVPDGIAEWIPRDFTPADLARAIGRILSLSDDVFDARVRAVRDHLERHFSFTAMARYYRGLWEAVR